MRLMTRSMVSHTWSIKGKKQAEGRPSHLSFKGLYWTQLCSMSHILDRDITFLSDT